LTGRKVAAGVPAPSAPSARPARVRPVDIGGARPHIAGCDRRGRAEAEDDTMADFPAPNAGAAANDPPISAGLLAYALFGAAAVIALFSSGFPAIAPLMGIVGIAGLIVAYVKRDDAQGSWVASHLRWLIRTFWYSFLWGIIGGIVLLVLGLVLIGIPIAFLIWAVASIWVIYRVIRGYLLFKDSKPIPGM
jgi:uncharacterized membrane protein